MNKEELDLKVSEYKKDIRNIIEEYVKIHAKYNIGDVVNSKISPNSYYIITQIGYDCNYSDIVYYGRKLRISDGEITSFDMNYGVGTREYIISKVTLNTKNGKEISHIDNYIKFDYKINIFFKV